MQIGPDNWRSVTYDSAFVPRGGMYGNVEEWAAKAEKHGMKLAWSWLRGCFFVYTIHFGVPVFQFRFWNEKARRPAPLTDMALWALVELRERHGQISGDNFARKAAKAAAEEDERIKREMHKDDDDRIKEVTREAKYGLGRGRPMRLIMPGTRGRLGRFSQGATA